MKYILALLCLLSSPALAATYKTDYAQSSISFSGAHMSKPFSGVFERWQAIIDFDPANLAASKIDVTIDTGSAKTGDKMYDGTLPTDDWFAVKDHPKATFTSSEIGKNADGSFTAKGTLTIRATQQPVSFTFTLTPDGAPQVKATANLSLDRLAFAIGQKSDAKAEWVSRDIKIDIIVVASHG